MDLGSAAIMAVNSVCVTRELKIRQALEKTQGGEKFRVNETGDEYQSNWWLIVNFQPTFFLFNNNHVSVIYID